MNDTIFALSSGQPPAAIAVMRISGPAAFDAVRRLAGNLPPPRHASLRSLRDGDRLLDRALVLIFPGPQTATGEDLAELHLHGARAVVRAVEAVLSDLPGLRPAEPGEFTRRALTNGRIDLTEAEGLGDLLAAETEAQRSAALRSVEGGVRRRIEAWSTRTLQLSALVEAMLDHGDEDDVAAEGDVVTDIVARGRELAQEIRDATSAPTVDRLHNGIRVVLAGPPNAGKSTLLNALADREVAIVSPLAGTTRDRIEAPVMRAGLAWLFTDTAGLHDAPVDMVERIGIERARDSLALADIILWLDDKPPPPDIAERRHILIHARSDLAERSDAPRDRIALSASTGEGLADLWAMLVSMASELVPPADHVALNLRQSDLASSASEALARLEHLSDPLLIAEELRHALRTFDRITGAADTEAMLDALFGRFCIGK